LGIITNFRAHSSSPTHPYLNSINLYIIRVTNKSSVRYC
jgi:hypothetical protein